MKTLTFLFCLATLARGQTTLVVTGTYDPLEISELDRSVDTLPVRSREILWQSWTDALRDDPSVQLLQRAPNGVQSDVSIRGGAFGQTLILLNGIRLNDAQTAHHNLDLPVPLEAIDRIEVLKGSGSTLYGADATAGAINVITRPPAESEVRLRAGFGNFGVNEQQASLGFSTARLSEQLSFGREFSSGFIPDRDYRNLQFGSSSWLRTGLGTTAVTLGYKDTPFGAAQFYGNYPSWEDTKGWFASLRQTFGNTEAGFAFRRHSDLFVLFRDRPAVYANHHADESWEGVIRRTEKLTENVSLHYGAEFDRDELLSNNLGNHDRNRESGYLALDVRALKRFSFSAEGREDVYPVGGAHKGVFSPTVAAGVWLLPRLKLRASAASAFRLPSYTDLYYHDPANIGNPALQPERAWTYEAGALWMITSGLRADAAVFQRRERNGIDYARTSTAAPWRAQNLARLNFSGVEAALDWRGFDVRYSALRGVHEALPGVLSKYVFNYPEESGVIAWRGERHGFVARTRLGVENQRARAPYALWDVSAAWVHRRTRPYVQLTNIADTRYQENYGIVMPGRALVGGVEYLWTPRLP